MPLHAFSADGGILVLLYDSTLTSDTASFDVIGIPSGFRSLQCILHARSTRAAQTEDPLTIKVNNDTGSNYDMEYSQNFGGSGQSAETLGGTIFGGTPAPCALPAASSPSGAATAFVLDIPNYSGTTFRKTFVARASCPLTDSGDGHRLWNWAGEWRSTSAINRLTFAPANGNFLTGSRLIIYGLN